MTLDPQTGKQLLRRKKIKSFVFYKPQFDTNDILHYRHSQAKCIVATAVCLCVCLSVCMYAGDAFLHYCTHPYTLDNGTCALLGGFAIGEFVSLLWQHSRTYKYNYRPVIRCKRECGISIS